MSFLKNIKSVFGFGSDEPEEEYAPDSSSAADTEERHAGVDTSTPLTASPEAVKEIFTTVVEVFNKALPSFLGETADAEKQKQYLYDALDNSMKEYISSLESAAQARSEALWEQERERLRSEADGLKQRTKELEQKRAEIHEKQLSADRQKRALSERVHDLEIKVISLEAEKEQFEIEHKSLINKAKVVQVYEKEIADLKEELQALSNHNTQGDNKEVDQLKAQVQTLTEENRKLHEACETAKVKDEMGGAMLNDLQSRASEAQTTARELEKKISALEDTLKLKDATIDDLNKAIEEKDAMLAESEESAAEIESIMEQMSKFEDVKTKLEDRIQKLKSELADLHKENDSLRTTIKNNLYIQAEQEKAMKDEIDNLRTVQADTNTIANETRQNNVEKSKAFEYPSLFETIGDTGVIKEDSPEDNPHTDDLIADTDWIKD